MNQKKIWVDPSFWVLIGINAYLVYYYYTQPQIFTTLIWLYWAQSVSLGFFNFADILTVGKVEASPITINGKETTLKSSMKRPGAFFFLLHYGFFHFVYFFFLLTMKRSGPFQMDFFKYFLFAFLVGQIINFIQHKIQQKHQVTNLSKMFATPYLRIIPMHLTILIPAFLHISNLGIFLILKAIADVLMYIITKPAGGSVEADKALLASKTDFLN